MRVMRLPAAPQHTVQAITCTGVRQSRIAGASWSQQTATTACYSTAICRTRARVAGSLLRTAGTREAMPAVFSTSASSFSRGEVGPCSAPQRQLDGITQEGPASPQPLRSHMQALVYRVHNAPSRHAPEVSAGEVRDFIEAAISANEFGLAVQLLEEVSSASGGTGQPLITPEIIRRLLMLASYSQNLDFADKLMTVVLAAPGERIDARVVELYASLVGDLPIPDHSRAAAFCNLALELGLNGFAPYLGSIARAHGADGMREAVDFLLKESLSLEALRCVLTALLNLGSVELERVFLVARDAAERESGGVRVQVVDMHPTTTTPPVPHSSLTAPLGLQPSPEATQAEEEVYGICVSGLLQLERLERAVEVLFMGIHERNLPLAYPTFLVAKKLVNVLSERQPSMNKDVADIVREVMDSPPNKDSSSPPQARAVALPAAHGSGGNQRDAILLQALVKCLHHLLEREALRPRLLFNSMFVFRGYGMLEENSKLVEGMLNNPVMRPNLLAGRHINPLLLDLLNAGKVEEADRLFERIDALDPRYTQTRPNRKTYNILIHYYAKREDKETVRELMSRMSEGGFTPDSWTLAAIPMLRTTKAVAHSADNAAEEWDVDQLFARSLQGLFGGRGEGGGDMAVGRNTLNQLMQAYFRVGKPVKALRVLQAMGASRCVPGLDTYRTLINGLAVAGGVEVSGSPPERVPIMWGGSMTPVQYEEAKKRATILRARVAAGTVAGRAPSTAISPSDASRLRAGGVSTVLSQHRTALLLRQRVLGTPLDDTTHWPPALFDTPKRAHLAWVGSESGQHLCKQLALFQPWPREAAARQKRLAGIQGSLGWDGRSIASALGQEVDNMELLTDTLATPVSLVADDALEEEGMFLRGDDNNNDSMSSGGNSGGGERHSVDAMFQDEESGGAGAAPLITHATRDFLPLLPRIFRWLRSMRMPLTDTYRFGDAEMSWSTTFLDPRRTLQLFLTLYNHCLWEDKLCVGTRASALIPGLTVIDLRRVHVASACVFVQAVASHLAMAHLSGAQTPATATDLVFLVGVKPGRMHAQIEELARVDLVPPMGIVDADRVIMCRRGEVLAWVEAEKARLEAAMRELV